MVMREEIAVRDELAALIALDLRLSLIMSLKERLALPELLVALIGLVV